MILTKGRFAVLKEYNIMNLPQKSSDSSESHAYLVRLWRVDPQEPWRATVKVVANGLEFHFASPEKLFLFLHEQTLHTLDNRT